MNLRQIEILRAVVRHHTTVAAAQALGLSQPAVSNAVKAMEAQLGFPLFERINNRLFPTREAQTLYEDADPIFALHGALEAKLQDLRENKAGQLRIIATPPLGHGVIPLALRRFLARRPKVRVFFDVRRFEGVVESVETNVAELGFLLGLGEHPALASKIVFSGEMVCVFRPEHPLAARAFVTPADLAPHRFIALQWGTRMGTAVRRAFEQAGQPFDFAVEVRYCNAACVLAESGVGVAIVDPLSPASGGRYRLAVRPFRPATPVTAHAAYARARPLSRLAAAFLQEVGTVAAESKAGPA
ncbi:MAG TPA: LysR family transcriptional regulator [Acetobacteraceae bacterium]|nr:LysR family transcriptional regulator [Acetobacteraceae bacterium]